MSATKDWTGQTFGRLTAIRFAGECNTARQRVWLWRCSCGSEVTNSAPDVKNGKVRSCGCLRREVAGARKTKHGGARANNRMPEYASWQGMLGRCVNPNGKNWHYYGGRGITVCDRWRHSFENFLADMGNRPSTNHSLDRIDNDKGYFPENCRWATTGVQRRNSRRIHLITFNGKTMCLTDWEIHLGFTPGLLNNRINKLKWPTEQALTTPLMRIYR